MDELHTVQGRHTELISIYIAQRTDLHRKIDDIRNEAAAALNIKDKRTRRNVVDALEKAIQYLKSRARDTPKKGLALFCGTLSGTQTAQRPQL